MDEQKTLLTISAAIELWMQLMEQGQKIGAAIRAAQAAKADRLSVEQHDAVVAAADASRAGLVAAINASGSTVS
jgi:hypothetical protein